MEYLQYVIISKFKRAIKSFKPYYKWNTFNTLADNNFTNGVKGFKPYYKWNTFNTIKNDNKNNKSKKF